MSEILEIKSHKGMYSVFFKNNAFAVLNLDVRENMHFIIDKKVGNLYENELVNVLNSSSILSIEALEENKTLNMFTQYIEYLVSRNIRKNHILIAIGGGIIQDIACFLSATLLRGLPWIFYPTTLLSQADSCIGSKSSINVGNIKNILGTFTPPKNVIIDTNVLQTLEDHDLRSGIGEMLKVHGIEGPKAFAEISGDYSQMKTDFIVLKHYIFNSLNIKKKLIEIDEFDQGPRNIMNYGHSFGHAIESATNFAIPHGIAVTIGLDMANYTSFRFGMLNKSVYQKNREVLKKNFSGFENIQIPTDKFFRAISKDKKNVDDDLRLILPDKNSKISAGLYPNDEKFRNICTDYLTKELLI